MAATRIYIVAHKANGAGARLIRAASPAAALRHVAEDELDVSVAKQDDLIRLLPNGVKVESNNDEPLQGDLPSS